jgi:hypothetical protein
MIISDLKMQAHKQLDGHLALIEGIDMQYNQRIIDILLRQPISYVETNDGYIGQVKSGNYYDGTVMVERSDKSIASYPVNDLTMTANLARIILCDLQRLFS